MRLSTLFTAIAILGSRAFGHAEECEQIAIWRNAVQRLAGLIEVAPRVPDQASCWTDASTPTRPGGSEGTSHSRALRRT